MSAPSVTGRLGHGLIAGLLGLTLAVASIAPATAAGVEVDVPDPKFRACLVKVLDGQPLTTDNLGTLKSVICSAFDGTIRGIEGAQHLTSAKSLVLNDSLLEDLRPIEGLAMLSNLRAGLHPDVDATPLASLRDPQVLQLTPVFRTQDLSAISELGHLTWLGLSTSDTSFPDLGGAVDAKTVSVSGANLTGLDGLQGLDTNLLQVGEADKLSDLTALRGSRITEVRMGNSRATPDLEPLKDVTGLEVLSVQVSGNDQVARIRHLASLRELDLGGSGPTDLTALQPPATLEKLAVWGRDLANLGPRGSLAQLTELRTWYASGITSLEALRGTTSLRLLEMPGSSIHDLTPLSKLPAGAKLDLKRNQIHDFSPLVGWTGTLQATDQTASLPDVTENEPYAVKLLDHRGHPLTPDPHNHSTYAAGVLTHHGVGFRQNMYWSGSTRADSPITLTVQQNVSDGKQFKITTKPAIPWASPRIGKTITLSKAPKWSPTPTSITYRWFRDASPISGANDSSYTPVAADAGSSLWVQVTAHRPGYADYVVESNYTDNIPYRTLQKTPTPKITYQGKLAVGTVLSAKPGSWDPGVTLRYQWQRDKKNIPGATGPTYQVTTADAGHELRVRVTGSKTGYLSKSGYPTVKKYSKQVTPAKAQFAASAKPKITGTRAVGKKLTASVDWTPTATLKYQWYRNGKKIKGATKAIYTLKASDFNDRLSVRVTASKSGYTTVAKTSSKTAKIKKGILTPGTATITGTPVAGEKLTAKSTAWAPGKVTLAYRWYRDGKAIKGATSRHYTIKKADASHALTVRITGKKSGYTTKSIKSSAMTANPKG